MSLQQVVLASNNAGKIREFQHTLGEHWDIIPQATFDIAEADETASTFVENALIKARHACLHSGLPALADDSGLHVDALQGEPGVRSARFAGPHAKTTDNIDKLLDALTGVAEASRGAAFRCVLVLMQHANDPVPLIAEGVWHGRILLQPQGMGGFGYDPIFWVPEAGCAASELSVSQKQAMSHRGLALRHLLDQIGVP